MPTPTAAARYVAGTLRRALADATTATYTFPVGSDSQFARLDLLSNQLGGTSYIDARFGPKPGSDTGLNCTESGPSSLRHVAVYSAGIWTLTPDAQPVSGSYAGWASLAPFTGLNDNNFGILKRPDSSTSAADWNVGGGTLSASDSDGPRVADGYALRSGLTSFSQFALGQAQTFTPLPVTLASFNAMAHGGAALLIWSTAQELNNDRFEAESSVDGQVFGRVGTVPGHGTSITSHSSRLTDAQLANHGSTKLVYYRLRQVDRDGSSHYSPVRVVAVGASLDYGFAVYPTLLGPGEALSYALGGAEAPQAEGAELTVYSLTGQRLGAQRLAAGTTGRVEMPALAAGWYLARLCLPDGRMLSASFGVQ